MSTAWATSEISHLPLDLSQTLRNHFDQIIGFQLAQRLDLSPIPTEETAGCI